MKYFSTFTGIGGFEIGIEKAYELSPALNGESMGAVGHERDSTDSNDGIRSWGRSHPLCVGYSEIDKYASSVYERHYPNVRNYGDITKINANELPDFDLLVGGFPCQAFSIAGKRRGFEDTRGTLFFDLARILKAKTPRLFVFENVKGLLSHDGGATFKTIIAATSELGYDCQWQVLNSKNHGVPQNRERIIIVGHLRGTPRPEVFPFIGGDIETSNAVTEKGQLVDLTRREPTNYRERKDGRVGTLDANYYKGLANQERPGVVVGTLRTHKDGNGFREMQSGMSPTLPARAREDGSGQPVIINPLKGQTGYGWHFEQNVYDKGGLTRTVKAGGGSGNTLKVIDDLRIRRLTPIECERLQAFPDNWTKYGRDGELISDTQRYKMCGNAVTTNVIRDVFEKILA